MAFVPRLRQHFIDEMARFASFYSDARNEAAQHVGFPLLVFTVFFIGAQHPIAAAIVWFCFFVVMVWYLFGEPRVGVMTAMVYGVIGAGAHAVAAEVAGWSAAAVGAATIVLALALRLLGRSLEGRRPSMSDRLRLLLIAPAFLTAALLFRFRVCPALELAILSRRGGHFPLGDPRWVEPSTRSADGAERA